MRYHKSNYPYPTDKKQHHKYLHRAAEERLTDGTRSMFVSPAFDYRGGENDQYGQHCAELTFVEKRKGLVIEVRFFTGWSVKQETNLGYNPFLCTGYYYHFDDEKEAKEMSSMPHHTTECVLSGGNCYGVAGSALYGEVLGDKLINEGSPAIWDDIDREFKEYGR